MLVSAEYSQSYIDAIRAQTRLNSEPHRAACFDSLTIDSAFQPVFSLAHKRIVGYEALARASDEAGRLVSSAGLFDRVMEPDRHIFLDRLCRYVHLANFQIIGDSLNWLLLNVSPQVVACGPKAGPYFQDLLREFSFPSHRVVIEIVEYPIADQNSILDTVQFYKELGCLIAIDDFGAGHSNFERIWMIQPHIVKLDRSMIVQAAAVYKIRQLLPGIISLLHQAGSLVLIEGIENEDQALIAMESDADFVQGYFFAKPARAVRSLGSGFTRFDELFGRFKIHARQQQHEIDSLYERYKTPFAKAIYAIKEGQPLGYACAPLMKDPRVVRCYMLEPDGIQIGATVSSHHSNLKPDKRFDPLSDAQSADWFRRHYLRRAISHPNQLQITRPYLSITGSHMCVTLSMMFLADHGRAVLCCDLNPNWN